MQTICQSLLGQFEVAWNRMSRGSSLFVFSLHEPKEAKRLACVTSALQIHLSVLLPDDSEIFAECLQLGGGCQERFSRTWDSSFEYDTAHSSWRMKVQKLIPSSSKTEIQHIMVKKIFQNSKLKNEHCTEDLMVQLSKLAWSKLQMQSMEH
ncbi:hypothetical protein MUK42_34180 [Musa troglodytarum]|uniref:Uncharacterized protein n=1 Tax=Musa troglodytarum TaxID=320322 RepID=A0A9E7FGT7_9LILI|nr:hypothetical protein MUK42_34180 [Musa troglodytarum]